MTQIYLIASRSNFKKWDSLISNISEPVQFLEYDDVIECELTSILNKRAMVLMDTEELSEDSMFMYLKKIQLNYVTIIDPKLQWAPLIIRNQHLFQVNDYIQNLDQPNDLQNCIDRYLLSLKKDPTDMIVGEYFVVKDKGESTFINLNNITVLEGLGAYTKVHSINKQYIVSKNLKKLLEQLPKCFIRTHRSYAVHINHINSLSGNQVLLHNGEKVKASKTGKKSLISRFTIA